MYYRDTDWNAYLVQRKANQGMIDALGQQTRDIARGQAALLQAQGITHQTLQRGFGSLLASQAMINATLQDGFRAVTQGLSEVQGSIEALHADFNLAMGEVIWKLEIQNQSLQSILETLQAPLDTAAKELRRRAEDAYRNGWYDDALRDFLESEQKNYQDFAVHQAIGNIYLYCQQPANLEQAQAYYLKAGKYAEPRSTFYAALAYMHAGFVCYLQKDDQKAIQYVQQATQLHPDFLEAWFTLAKFAAAAKQPAIAIPALEKAIRAERSYALKARADGDFTHIEGDVTTLMQRLYDEAQQEAHKQWQEFQKQNIYLRWYPGQHNPAQIPDLLQEQTYFGYREALLCLEECHTEINKVGTDATLKGHGGLKSGAVYSVSWKGGLLASYGTDEKVIVWEVSKIAKERHVFKDYRNFIFNPNPDMPVYAAFKRHKGFVQVFSKDQEMSIDLDGMSTPFITFSPNGSMLAGLSIVAKEKGPLEYTITIWDTETLKKSKAITFQRKFKVDNFIAMVRTPSLRTPSLCFTPDGRQLASSLSDKIIYLWDVSSGKEEKNLQVHSGRVSSVAFSPDGKLLASALDDHTIILWDYASSLLHTTLKGHTGPVHSVSFSPNGKYLASGSKDKTIRIWDIDSCQQVEVIEGHTGGVNTVAFSPGGWWLASGSDDKTVRLWSFAVSR
jgi:WD40 repeat protein